MGGEHIRHQSGCYEDVPNWKRKRRVSNQSRCRRRSRRTEREREPTGIALPCQLERTHVHVHELAFQWDCVLSCPQSLGRISYATERYSTEVLKTEWIKLPADANIEEDDLLFPPVRSARLNRGRHVQEVAAAPRGRRRINRIIRVRRCGNCNQPGHIRSKCRFNYVWFDWDDANDNLFREVYRRSIPGAQQTV